MRIEISDNHKVNPQQRKADINVIKNSVMFSRLPDTIIIHYTAGSSAASSAAWLADPTVKASAHVVIGRNGDIYQLVPFNTIAWHAGTSAYGGRSSFNNFSIGIELDNAGFLAPYGDEFVSAFGQRYTSADVVKGIHRNEKTFRYWHKYPAFQLDVCYALCESLIRKYPITKILGHEEISPAIKLDPGPAFPLDDFRIKLLP